MALIQTVAPATVAVTLDEIKRHLRLSTASTVEDDMLTLYGKVATKQCENMTKRQIIHATYQVLLDKFPDDSTGKIELLRPPLATAIAKVAITFFDSSNGATTVPTSHYTTNTGALLPFLAPTSNNSWADFSVFDRPNAITIQYIAGYSSNATAAVPVEMKLWILRKIGMFYEYREPITTDDFRTVPDGTLDGLTILTIP